jgi:hypothetical protein
MEYLDVDGSIIYKMNLTEHGNVFIALIWLRIRAKGRSF